MLNTVLWILFAGRYEKTSAFKRNKEIVGGTSTIVLGEVQGTGRCCAKVCKNTQDLALYSIQDILTKAEPMAEKHLRKEFKLKSSGSNKHLCCFGCFNEMKWMLAFLNNDLKVGAIPSYSRIHSYSLIFPSIRGGGKGTNCWNTGVKTQTNCFGA